MKLLSLCVAVAVLSNATAAPVPKHVRNVDYYPFQVGNKWVSSGTQASTCEIIEVKEVEGTKNKDYTMKMTTASNGMVRNYIYRVDDEQVSALGASEGNGQYKAPVLTMKKVLVENETWESNYEFKEGPIIGMKSTVGTVEWITVNKERFRAIKVSYKYISDGTSGAVWYANGIGPVKSEMNGSVTSELKEFTRGSGKPR